MELWKKKEMEEEEKKIRLWEKEEAFAGERRRRTGEIIGETGGTEN